jgi:hypothetical protein
MAVMHRVTRVLPLLSLALCVACDRRSDEFIYDTQPFFEVRVRTPPDGKIAIAERGKRFAKGHRLAVHFVPDHFEEQEYTLSLVRRDLNIVAGNVLSGATTYVTATSRGGTTGAQRAEVNAYLCEVMQHGCPH